MKKEEHLKHVRVDTTMLKLLVLVFASFTLGIALFKVVGLKSAGDDITSE